MIKDRFRFRYYKSTVGKGLRKRKMRKNKNKNSQMGENRLSKRNSLLRATDAIPGASGEL